MDLRRGLYGLLVRLAYINRCNRMVVPEQKVVVVAIDVRAKSQSPPTISIRPNRERLSAITLANSFNFYYSQSVNVVVVVPFLLLTFYSLARDICHYYFSLKI